jgi:DNA-binding NarL/FixJ family response regulator
MAGKLRINTSNSADNQWVSLHKKGGKMIRVILAEDHDILREGLKSLFRDDEDIKIVAEAANGKILLDLLETTPADVVLMDINMPVMNGLEATRQIIRNFRKVKVLVLSMMDHPGYLKQMMEAGAEGYLLKNASKEELVKAIHSVFRGQTYISPEISVKAAEMAEKDQGKAPVRLTKRELQVLELLAEGLTNKEIAEKIFLSKRTVETHRKNLIDKTNSKNSSALIRYAIENGLLKNNPPM